MKMTKKFDDLNETFNVSNDIITPEVEPAPVKKIEEKKSSTDITKDYEYTRGNLYSLIEKGQEAINGILELAQETEQARAYEVAGQLIKSVADATDKLMELQKRLKEVEEEKQTKGPSTVNNALFVGSTADLAKLLKKGLPNEEQKAQIIRELSHLMTKHKCPSGEYYCYTDKKCKPIPKGFKMVGPAGYLRKENGHSVEDEAETKKNGNGSNGNGNGNGGGSVSEANKSGDSSLRDWFGKSRSSDGKLVGFNWVANMQENPAQDNQDKQQNPSAVLAK